MRQPDLPSRYEISALLGEGGSGRVYRVHDALRLRDLALKVVTSAETGFLRGEFEALRQLRHENLVQVFDWGGLPTGEAYYTMELIEGEDWGHRVGALQDDAEVRRILTGILRGIAHLHCHGEVHGDLKPSNVLLGAKGGVRVTDVGMGSELGSPRGGSMTPGYSAPEVWEGNRPDERSDLYSIGVMTYEALTGEHPFIGRTIRQVVSGQLEGWVPTPAARGVTVAPDLERAVMRALERDPALRYSAADEWLEGLAVEDTVGQILRGKFVDRANELADRVCRGDGNHGCATLTCYYGEPGIGRATILEELVQRALVGGALVVRLRLTDFHDPRDLATQSAAQIMVTGHEFGETLRRCESWGDVADCLVNRQILLPLLLSVDGREAHDTVATGNLRRFARLVYQYAAKTERDASNEFRIVVALDAGPVSPEDHESFVRVAPFDEANTRAQIEGLLGRHQIPAQVFQRIHALTRGVPGLSSAAAFELIDSRTLRRRAGIWQYDESRPPESLAIDAVKNPLGQLWRRTPEYMRDTLVAVALLRSGAHDSTLSALGLSLGGTQFGHLSELGWLRRVGNAWMIASSPLRSVVLAAAGSDRTKRVATSLLRGPRNGITAEDLGDLLLTAGSGQEVWQVGMESIRTASSRGEHHLALERATQLAGRVDLNPPVLVAAELALLRAGSMNQTGADRNAVDLLLDPARWDVEGIPMSARTRRARLLGVTYRTVGDVEAAKRWLQEAVHLAGDCGDQKEYLQALAEMTQLEWEHGTKIERERAIAMIRSALALSEARDDVVEERAALVYGLGAALIWNGERVEARAVLLDGVAMRCSDYWKMRMANALSSVTMALGEYEGSLQWSSKAWDLAERSGTDWFRARILANRGATLHALGRLRESADVDMAAAEWGRRTGNPYEYEAGIAGAAINLLLLARYEDALARAKEAHAAAVRDRNERHIAKGLELRALAHFSIGELDEASRLLHQGQLALAMHEYVDTKPRLDWLEARIAIESGDLLRGLRKLEAVESGLRQIPDLEDLWGVEVELYLARGRVENNSEVVSLLGSVVDQARSAGSRLAWVSGAAAIGEIVDHFGIDDREFRPLFRDGLAVAEECGMLELSWQLAYRLGVSALKEGSSREAQTRFTHAMRIVREIASHLTPPHRSSYLKRRHVSSALETMARQMS